MVLSTWIKASRPKTLIASMSPVLIGTSLAYSAHVFNFGIFLLTLLTGLGIQISTNFTNDLFDFLKGADTASRKGPVRVTQSGLASVAQMKIACITIMGSTAVLGSLLAVRGGTSILFLLALALVLAIGYTAGPFPLAYLGIAEVFIFVFFGPIACGYTYYLQTLSFAVEPFIAGLAPGLISCSLLVVNNIRDIEDDRKVKKKTLAARFGAQFGKWEYTLCLIIGLLFPILFMKKHAFLTLICLFPAALIIRAIWKTTDPYAYNPLLRKTGQLLNLYTLTFCLHTIL